MQRITGFILVALLLWGCNDSGDTFAEIETDYGVMKVRLYNSTPGHRDNFVKLAEEGFYDGLLFHRVIPGFMIQGGDPDSRNAAPGQMLGGGGPGYQLPAEFGAFHFRGALAAARTGDQVNPRKESSGSQFYIVEGKSVSASLLDQIEKQRGIQYTPEQRERYLSEGGAPFLDNEYTVFGEVVEGMEVIGRITALATDPSNRPQQDVKMKVRILD